MVVYYFFLQFDLDLLVFHFHFQHHAFVFLYDLLEPIYLFEQLADLEPVFLVFGFRALGKMCVTKMLVFVILISVSSIIQLNISVLAWTF